MGDDIMIFTKLTVENYGLFRGANSFDLLPSSSEKPIVLFGGKNGAGKTTLFEAFRLCLYGNSFMGFPLSENKYHRFLKNRIHRYPGLIIQPDKTSITLEFKFVQLGRTDYYSVTRFWQLAGAKAKESLEIYKNSSPLSDIEAEQWQEFVNELIPPGVANLFFFDGEQIQNLAEDENSNIHLKESFDSLVGLGLVERLSLDLKYVASRTYAKSEGESASTQIDELTAKHSELGQKLKMVESDMAQIQTDIDYLKGQIQKKEQLIAQEGGGYANRRQELKLKKEALDAEIKLVQERIKELAAGLLPFAIIPDQCEALRIQLEKEQGHLQKCAAEKVLEEKLQKIQKSITLDDFWKGIEHGDERLRMLITDRLARTFQEETEYDKTPVVRMIHDVSPGELQKLFSWIDEVKKKTHTESNELSVRLERAVRERQDIEKQLTRIPPDEILHPHIQELNKLHAEIGALEQKLVNESRVKGELKFKSSDVVSRLKKQYEKIDETSKQSTKASLAIRTQKLLSEYLIHIRKKKLTVLEEQLVTALNHLSHKKMYQRAKIDPKDFSVTLYDVNGDQMSKEQLSAGEKQIYAIAMLWALARTSGRPLPFIIDTPLGRLDAEHRTNLVSNFFPFASHQSIIFSTNTEIDERYFNELEDHLSRAYLISFDRKQGKSEASEGYFWKKRREIAV